MYEGTEVYINPLSQSHWTECKVRGKCGWALKTNFEGLMLALKQTKKQAQLSTLKSTTSKSRSRSPKRRQTQHFLPDDTEYSPDGSVRKDIWKNLSKKPALKSIPINDRDLAPKPVKEVDFSLLDKIELDQIRDKRKLFEGYDQYRL